MLCPTDYLLDFPKEPTFECECAYIVGGLYGNIFALNEILNMAKSENYVKLIFNGDFHWFDIKKETFCKIEDELQNHFCILGNVEMELLRQNNQYLGCRCNYPKSTNPLTIKYSNEIHCLLHGMVHKNLPHLLLNFKNLLKCALVKVGDCNVAISHGDEKSLSGWLNSWENLNLPQRQKDIISWLGKNKFDILASTHTCLPACFARQNGVVINNGSAGMANFNNTTYGLITRIATTPHEKAIYRVEHNNVFIEALKVEFDFANFIVWFRDIWDEKSPAYKSYFNRINGEINNTLNNVIIKGFKFI